MAKKTPVQAKITEHKRAAAVNYSERDLPGPFLLMCHASIYSDPSLLPSLASCGLCCFPMTTSIACEYSPNNLPL